MVGGVRGWGVRDWERKVEREGERVRGWRAEAREQESKGARRGKLHLS